jgi:hypothetical protein
MDTVEPVEYSIAGLDCTPADGTTRRLLTAPLAEDSEAAALTYHYPIGPSLAEIRLRERAAYLLQSHERFARCGGGSPYASLTLLQTRQPLATSGGNRSTGGSTARSTVKQSPRKKQRQVLAPQNENRGCWNDPLTASKLAQDSKQLAMSKVAILAAAADRFVSSENKQQQASELLNSANLNSLSLSPQAPRRPKVKSKALRDCLRNLLQDDNSTDRSKQAEEQCANHENENYKGNMQRPWTAMSSLDGHFSEPFQEKREVYVDSVPACPLEDHDGVINSVSF